MPPDPVDEAWKSRLWRSLSKQTRSLENHKLESSEYGNEIWIIHAQEVSTNYWQALRRHQSLQWQTKLTSLNIASTAVSV